MTAPSPTARARDAWRGEPGTTGRVTVVGAGKIGLPLAALFASAGWDVIAADKNQRVVDAINAGRSPITEEPGLAEMVAEAHAAGRLRATTDTSTAVGDADVVVVIVPVMLSESGAPDYRSIDSATEAIGRSLRAPSERGGPTLVIFETTLPVGDTRGRLATMLSSLSGLPAGDAERGFLLAFSPERVFSGRIFRDLGAYPKLVGGINAASTDRAAAFYRTVLPAEVRELSSTEAAEFAKLAETTYRDVNIALANEFARYADRIGVDVQEVIDAANSQPFSHVHQPGLGVGGHCLPVYSRFLITRAAEDFRIAALARTINDEQVDRAVTTLDRILGGIAGLPVLVLGLTYREGVAEVAYSRGLALIDRLHGAGADVWAYDPLLGPVEVERYDAKAYRWGEPGPFRVIVTQTGDPRFAELNLSLFGQLRVLYDGRNRLRGVELPPGVRYIGVGVQELSRARRKPRSAANS